MIQSLCAVVALMGLAACTAGSYTITALGTMVGSDDSRGLEINNFADTTAYGTTPGAILANGGMSHRNSLPAGGQGRDLSEARGIHDAGRIAGNGFRNGQSRAFRPSPTANPPKPGLFAIAGAALLGFLARRRCYGSQRAGLWSPGLCTLGMLTSLAAIASTSYTITDLGVLPGNRESYGFGINNAGQVTGYSHSLNGDRAFLWSNGVMADLGTLPGGTYSRGNAINDSGQVAGYSSSSNGHRAVLWSNGVMTDLGTLPGGNLSYGYAINESGQVTGNSYSSNGGGAVLWSNGVMADLGRLPGGYASYGYAINESGQVAGFSYSSSGEHAVLWSNGVVSDLGTLPGGNYSRGYAINDSGQVTGRANTPAGQYAFIYSDGVMSDLNTQLINGQGWTLLEGRGINDLGQITGFGILNNNSRAFLLTPVADTPEPATTLLVSAAILAALARRRFPQNPKRGSQ